MPRTFSYLVTAVGAAVVTAVVLTFGTTGLSVVIENMSAVTSAPVRWPLVGLFFVVLVVYPSVAWSIRWRGNASGGARPRALYLPNGTIRAMLALLTAGTFVMVLGSQVKEHFEEVLTAFGTLTGTMVGFYFGTRGVQKREDIDGQMSSEDDKEEFHALLPLAERLANEKVENLKRGHIGLGRLVTALADLEIDPSDLDEDKLKKLCDLMRQKDLNGARGEWPRR